MNEDKTPEKKVNSASTTATASGSGDGGSGKDSGKELKATSWTNDDLAILAGDLEALADWIERFVSRACVPVFINVSCPSHASSSLCLLQILHRPL